MTCPVFTSSVDASLSMTLLPAVLSLTAGSVDVISFLGLGGLFPAHITGNLVILAAHIVNAGEAPVALMLSVPVFVVMLGLTRLVIGGLKSLGLATLRPLLLLQLLLLVAFFILCFSVGSHIESERDERYPCWHAWRFGDGGAERTRSGLVERSTGHRGNDDQHYSLRDGLGRGSARPRSRGYGGSAAPG
jgi:hypothetical protein